MIEELTLKNDIVFKIFFSKAGHERRCKASYTYKYIKL